MPRLRKAKPLPSSPLSESEQDSSDELDVSPPPVIDPYSVLELDRVCTAVQVKSAYHRLALRHHPDKVAEADKSDAHTRFQKIAFAYAVLSDPTRRARYDATGSTADSLAGNEDGFSWAEFFREQFRDSISADSIAKFGKKYKGSDEESDDALKAYEEVKGHLDGVFQRVILCEEQEDRDRITAAIQTAIDAGTVPKYPKFKPDSKAARAKREVQAKAEEQEAIEHAKELGIHDQVFGTGKAKGKKEDPEAGLAALIRARQEKQNPDAFFDHLLDKYGSKGNKDKAGSSSGFKKRSIRQEQDVDVEMARSKPRKKTRT